MKVENAKRAAILAEALDVYARVERETKAGKPKHENDGERWLVVEAFDGDDEGGTSSGGMMLDCKTGLRILPFVRKIIIEELRELGVEMEDDPA